MPHKLRSGSDDISELLAVNAHNDLASSATSRVGVSYKAYNGKLVMRHHLENVN